jgi:galactofuranose transport system permease protein
LVIATGGIDLSVGALMAIAGAMSPMFFTGELFLVPNIYVGIALGIIFPIIIASFFGLFNGWLINRFSIQPIIATLVLFIAGRGIAQVSTNGDLQVFKVPEFQAIAIGRVLGVPFQVWIMVVVVIIAAFVLHRTVFGRQVLAVGGNEEAARLSGVPVKRVKLIVYTVSGICSGIAGLIVIAMNSAADANLIGLGMELDAIAAVAVGGTLLTGGRATILGTLLGALIIQLVRYTLLANGVPDAAALVVKAGLIILAVWLQRQEHA